MKSSSSLDILHVYGPDIKETNIKSNKVIKSKLVSANLDNKTVICLDYENVAYIPPELILTNAIYYLFSGKETNANASAYRKKLQLDNVHIIETTKTGPNFVDNKISLYIGYIFGRYTPEKVILVSNDSDYQEMTKSLQNKGFSFEIYRTKGKKNPKKML